MEPVVALVGIGVLLAGLAAGFVLGRRRPAAAPRPGAARPLTALEAGVLNVINLLNNRLNAIVGFAELARRSGLDPETREALDQVRAEADAAAGIVRELIHLVRQPGPGEGTTHLPTLLRDVLDLKRAELEALHVTVSLEVEPAVSLVVGDPPELANLVSRLAAFAVQRLRQVAPSAPRHVTWTARPLGASVVLVQEDSGPPLPHGLAWHELNYFRPADPGFAGALELALAQRVAENCGAGLRLEAGPAGGAEVTVTLIPGRLLESPLPRAPSGGAPAADAGLRLLLAEDDDGNRRAMTRLLESYGHDVVAVADGELALERLAAAHFDVVIVDLQMPRLGGQGVYEQTLARTPDVARRFVFVTGDAYRAASHDFLMAVPQPVVRKPYEIDDLLAALARVRATRASPAPSGTPRSS